MPYNRKGNCVYKETGDKVGCSKTPSGAEKYMKALYAAEKPKLKEMKLITILKELSSGENIADITIGTRLKQATGKIFSVVNNRLKQDGSDAGYITVKDQDGKQMSVSADDLKSSKWEIVNRTVREQEEIPVPPENKQYQITGKLITNTQIKPQTDILSAIRAIPGVTIVNSSSSTPTANAENKLRYEANIDVKIDTSAVSGDLKAGIKKIIEQIKNIDGVIDFSFIPKAKTTKPY